MHVFVGMFRQLIANIFGLQYVAPESILGVGVGEGVDWVRANFGNAAARHAEACMTCIVGSWGHLSRISYVVPTVPRGYAGASLRQHPLTPDRLAR